MCGIVGSVLRGVNGYCASDTKILDELLYMDALRGDDATGVAALYTSGELQVVKDNSEASFFRYQQDYVDVYNKIIKNGKAVIGHNRKKTLGGNDDVSAHPFIIDNRYAFVHNGTLTNHTSLTKELLKNLEEIEVFHGVAPTTDVDSEVLGTMLCMSEGNKEKLENMLGKVWGAYACVWIDQEEEKLYMVRNAERPLYLATTSAGWFWASEQAFLYAACNRNRLKIDECVLIDTDTLYSFDLSAYTSTVVKEKLSPKKAPASTKGPTTDNTKGIISAESTVISKKAFKKFQRRILNTHVSFVVDDYVERTVGDKGKSGWHIWGTNEEDDLCRGVLPPMSEVDLFNEYCSGYIGGVVDAVVHEDNGTVTLYLKNLNAAHSYETCH